MRGNGYIIANPSQAGFIWRIRWCVSIFYHSSTLKQNRQVFKTHFRTHSHYHCCWHSWSSAPAMMPNHCQNQLGQAVLPHRVNSSPTWQMSAISQTIFSDSFFVSEKFCILIKNSLKFVAKGPIDNKPPSVWIMAWRRIGDRPLSKSMLTWFTVAYMRHQGRWVNRMRCSKASKSISLQWRHNWCDEVSNHQPLDC